MPKENTKPLGAAYNYGYRPAHIGQLLKQKAETRKWKPNEVAARLKIETRTVYKIYKRATMPMPDLIKWSELLGENLLLLYRPNLLPEPDPTEAFKTKAEADRLEIIRLEHEPKSLRAFYTKQEGKIEELEDLIKEFMRRKG